MKRIVTWTWTGKTEERHSKRKETWLRLLWQNWNGYSYGYCDNIGMVILKVTVTIPIIRVDTGKNISYLYYGHKRMKSKNNWEKKNISLFFLKNKT